MPWEISLLYFFSWNFIWFLQKEPTTVQNFRLSTAQVKFHQICTLVGYFCWVVQNLKRNLFFVSKMTRTWWILIRALKRLKNLHFDWSLLCKVYNVWPKKVQRSVFHHTETLKSHAKFEEKLTCGLEKDMRNLANFYQSTHL